MVQMIRQMSEQMRQAMREMSDFTIHTGCPDTDGAAIQQVVFEWVSRRNPDLQRYNCFILGHFLTKWCIVLFYWRAHSCRPFLTGILNILYTVLHVFGWEFCDSLVSL